MPPARSGDQPANDSCIEEGTPGSPNDVEAEGATTIHLVQHERVARRTGFEGFCRVNAGSIRCTIFLVDRYHAEDEPAVASISALRATDDVCGNHESSRDRLLHSWGLWGHCRSSLDAPVVALRSLLVLGPG